MILAQAMNVSRETMERLELYHALLLKWTARINLVSSGDKSHIWTRHIADSVQLSRFVDDTGPHWLDLGSGGGLPGLVLAILHHETRPTARHTLVESDSRKAAFLLTAASNLQLDVAVHAVRSERLEPQGADVVTARAFAPLDRLLEEIHRHIAPGGMALLPKGRTVDSEIASAASRWRFQHELLPSATDPKSSILRLWNLSRA